MADQSGTAVYQLRPKAAEVGVEDLREHVILIEDDVMISEVVVTVLEDDGYAVVGCLAPVRAIALLQQIPFDLVITDGSSRVPGAVFVAECVRRPGEGAGRTILTRLIGGSRVAPVAASPSRTLLSRQYSSSTSLEISTYQRIISLTARWASRAP